MVFGFGFFKRGAKARKARIGKVYQHLVVQARQPVFYDSFKVADTLSGRFDMIVLHAFLFFQRLKDEDASAKEFAQEVFDAFFEDMDGALRELGVGYQAVPKRIKKMGEAFYGRVSAYDIALESALKDGDLSPLSDALHRNIFPDEDGQPKAVVGLADYMQESARGLATYDLEALYDANFSLPNPDRFLMDSPKKEKAHV